MCLEERIKTHSREVENGTSVPSVTVCRRCHQRPPGFRAHDRRRRMFLVVVSWMVKRVEGWLMRWKCPLCERTFTDYAGLAVPHKRYVAEVIRERSKCYLSGEAETYVAAAKKEGWSLLHEEEGKDGRALSPSTVWRWVGFLGGMKETLRQGLKVIREKAPKAQVHRPVLPLDDGEMSARDRLVARARYLLLVGEMFKTLFDREFFPDFAIQFGFA